jgi:membrane-associated phospholipid phosphatase
LIPTALAAAILCVLSIAVIDGPLAIRVASISPEIKQLIRQATHAVEILFGFPVSSYLYGVLLILGGLVMRSKKQTLLPRALLFVGLSQVTARLVTGILKTPFSRLRPFEALTPDGWHDVWFAPVGNSFPSGHAVHFWGFYFPLLILFPRYRYPLAILPILVSAARVAVNDHYLSDVIASAAIAAVATAVFARVILSGAPANSR